MLICGMPNTIEVVKSASREKQHEALFIKQLSIIGECGYGKPKYTSHE